MLSEPQGTAIQSPHIPFTEHSPGLCSRTKFGPLFIQHFLKLISNSCQVSLMRWITLSLSVSHIFFYLLNNYHLHSHFLISHLTLGHHAPDHFFSGMNFLNFYYLAKKGNSFPSYLLQVIPIFQLHSYNLSFTGKHDSL